MLKTLIHASGFAAAALPLPAAAQWTVTNLHPAGATESRAVGVDGAKQVGEVVIGGRNHAALWSGSGAAWIDLHPAGAFESWASGVEAGQQVGRASFGDVQHAGLWAGSAASWLDLHPAGAAYSAAVGVGDGQQVGYAAVGTQQHASLWTGSGASWVDLHPSGSTARWSQAFDAGDGQQVGVVSGDGWSHGALWYGSGASWVDLEPAGAHGSAVVGVDDGQQVGFFTVWVNYLPIPPRGAFWSGTPASVVTLGASSVWVHGVSGGVQVGYATINGAWHAGLWSGSAASWVDLHALLPPGFSWSNARGVSSDANGTFVVGHGYNTLTGRVEALLWTRVNCYPDCDRNGQLTVQDFGCFQTFFVIGDPYADCNADGQHTVADFGCFQTKFVQGCP